MDRSAKPAATAEMDRADEVQPVPADNRSAATTGRDPAMAPHPIAELFPPVSPEGIAALAADIKEQGQLSDIVTLEGMILDGRARYKACREAGIEPRFKEFEGAEPVGFVLSQNLHRRHLTGAQRAMVAARLAQHTQGRPAKSGQLAGLTQEAAAKALGVNERTVRRAVEVVKHGVPELHQLVDTGAVSVSAAAEVAAKREPDSQRDLVALGPKEVKRVAREARLSAAIAKRDAEPAAPSGRSADQPVSPGAPATLPSTSADEGDNLARRLRDLGLEVRPDDLVVAPGTPSAQARPSDYALVRIPNSLPDEKRDEMRRELIDMRDKYNTQVVFTVWPKV